ncbi:MAG TPA: peptidoglycan-associated lipoprotein Pal [Myxococcota bacterium]|nr:peptidoglycan-associated lipoprotein Pal [Myxococcota bacterium]
MSGVVLDRKQGVRRLLAPLAILGLVAAVGVLGCSKKKPAEEEPGIGSSEFKTGDGSHDSESSEPERVRELATIYFDYDSSDLRSDARTTLKSNAQAIQAHTEWKLVTVEGHCDERGSEEYNLALGERRANATKKYLSDLGVSPARMKAVSFGSSSPAVQGHDESAWRWNRRVDFRVTR